MNKLIKKQLHLYGNDSTFHVTISTGSNAPSSIPYIHVVLKLPEDFVHFTLMVFQETD
jgi:hypothetical protein